MLDSRSSRHRAKHMHTLVERKGKRVETNRGEFTRVSERHLDAALTTVRVRDMSRGGGTLTRTGTGSKPP